MKRLIYGIGIMCLAVAGCSEENPIAPETEIIPESPDVSPTSEDILYSSDRDGSFDIWHQHEEEDDPITFMSGDSWWPRMSGTAEKILFYHSGTKKTYSEITEVNDYGTAGLWVMDVDGSNAEEIIPTQANGWEQHGFANWSPAGDKIVMSALDPVIGTWQIYTTNASGTDMKKISLDDSRDYLDPVYAPDGNSIACVALPATQEGPEDLQYEIFLIDVETGAETRLTNNLYKDHHPDFSSDGSKIVFESLTDPDYLGIGKWSLREVEVASGIESNLLNEDGIFIFARYTPDDAAVYFNQVDLISLKLRIARIDLADGQVTYLTGTSFNAMNVDPF